MLVRIRHHLVSLRELEVLVVLVSILGHADIHYNDLADGVAKQAVIDAADLRPISKITSLTCKKLISKQCQSRWQRCWDRATTGRVTHDFIPSVNLSRIYPISRCCAISFVTLLLLRECRTCFTQHQEGCIYSFAVQLPPVGSQRCSSVDRRPTSLRSHH